MAEGITWTGHPADDDCWPPDSHRRMKDEDTITPDPRAEEARHERSAQTRIR